MYTTDDKLKNVLEAKETREVAGAFALQPIFSPQEQKELEDILKKLAKSSSQKVSEIVTQIIANNFDLSSTTSTDVCDIFDYMRADCIGNQFSVEHSKDVMALLTFCARVGFINKNVTRLLYLLIMADVSVENQEKMALFNLFLKSANSSEEMDFRQFIDLIRPNYSDCIVAPTLIHYINRFGIDDSLLHYSSEKCTFIENILYKIDLRALENLTIFRTIEHGPSTEQRANVLLLEMLCKQENRLQEVQHYPFFQPILAWGFNVLKEESIERGMLAIVNKTLALCLNSSLVKFNDPCHYFDSLEAVIKKLDSYRFITLMAKHEITIALSDSVKRNYLNKLLDQPQNDHAKTKINLIRLGLYWNIFDQEMRDRLEGGALPDLKAMTQDFAIQREDKKVKAEETIIHIQATTKVIPIPQVGDSLFGHIHNDFWLRGTRWEGNKFVNTLGYIEYILKKLGSSDAVPQYCRIHLQNANTIVKWIEAFRSQGNIQVRQPHHRYLYAYHLAQCIQRLFEQENYVAIPAGWSDGSGSGHAVVYAIVQREQQSYLMIFNTGDGIQYHTQRTVQGRTQFFNSKTFLIQDQHILTGLIIELLMPALVENLRQGARTIYENILPNFAQYIAEISSEAPLNQLGVEVIDPQFSGTCSWTAAETWLHSLFKYNNNSDIWRQLLLKIKYHNFVEYLESLKQGCVLSGQQRLITQAKQGLHDKQLWDKLTQGEQGHLASFSNDFNTRALALAPQKPQTPRASCVPSNPPVSIVSLLRGPTLLGTHGAVSAHESKTDSDAAIQQTFEQLARLITMPEACCKPENWERLRQLCQTLSDNHQFDHVIYYIEQWLSQINYSTVDNKNTELLYTLMREMTELNYVYGQALYQNAFVHTKEKLFMTWSTVLFGELAEKYFQNFLNEAQRQELQDSFLTSLKRMSDKIEPDQLLILDHNDIVLLKKIKTVLEKAPKQASFSFGYTYIGLIGEYLRVYGETARSVATTINSCMNEDNISILSLIELWKSSVKNKNWHPALKDKIETKDLAKINHFFYIAAMFILNVEYSRRLVLHERPLTLVEHIIGVREFDTGLHLYDINPPHKLIVVEHREPKEDVFPTIPSNHLIKKVMAIKKAIDDDSEDGITENVSMIVLRNHFPSNFRIAYLLYLICEMKVNSEGEAFSKHVDLINTRLFITFFKECQLRLLEPHYQTFVFHNLFNFGYIANLKDDPACTELAQILQDSLSSCQKDNHLDLAMLFYIKTIYSLYLANPQNPVFESTITRIDNMIEQCVSQKNSSFLLHQLYCYQFLFAWNQYCCYLEEQNGFNPETRLRLMARVLQSRLKMTQDIYTVFSTEQHYADDQLLNKFIQNTEIRLENHLRSRQNPFVDSTKFLEVLSSILQDSPVLKQAQTPVLTPQLVAGEPQVKFGELLRFDFSKSTWIVRNNRYSKLIPYAIAKNRNYGAIFGSEILLAETNGRTYDIAWKGNDYFIDAISGGIVRHVTVLNQTHKMQLISLEQLASHDQAITKITKSLPLILLEKDYTLWVNADFNSDVVFVLAHQGEMIWLGDSAGNIKKVLQTGSELKCDDTQVLLAPQDLPTYVPWALNFEFPWYIVCTASKMGDQIQPVSVRFLRYGLVLTAESEAKEKLEVKEKTEYLTTSAGNTWHLQGRPNWVLALHSENVWLPHFNCYLLFKENATSNATPRDSLLILPYLKKFHAELGAEYGEYLQSSCEHGNYLLKLDTHFAEIFALKDPDFQRARQRFITDTANSRLSNTQKYLILRWASEKNAIELQSLNPQQLWYLAYIYLSQHQPDLTIPILRELKQRVCFSNVEECLILKWIFCEMPARFSLTMKGHKFEEKATISNPDYVAAKLYALFILASHQTLNFSLLTPAPTHHYIVARDMLNLHDYEFLEAILGVLSDYIHLTQSSAFNNTIGNYLSSQELNIALLFVKAYRDQTMQDCLEKLQNKKLLLKVEQVDEHKAIDERIQCIREYCDTFDQYFAHHATVGAMVYKRQVETTLSQAIDYEDYNYRVPPNVDVKAMDENRKQIQRCYEDKSQKRLRPIQEQCLAAFNKDNQLFAMPMGSGKTKVVLPCLAALNADGVHLATMIFLEELFVLNSGDFKKTCMETLGLQAYEFMFDRGAKYSPVRFQAMYEVLKEIILSKGCVVSNRESFAALELTYIELVDYWNPQQKNAEALSRAIFEMDAILNLILERNIFFIDEMDSSCDVKKRNLIYPIGEPAKPQEALFELFLACYNVLMTIPEISVNLSEGNALPKQKLDNFQVLLKTIIQAMMNSSDILAIIRKKTTLTNNELFLYLKNERSIDQKSYVVRSLYELLHHILSLALSLDLNGKFGFSKRELDPIKRHQAIPFKSTQRPSEGSSYSKYLLTIWLTICAVRTEGVFQNLLENILLSFKLKYMTAVIPKDELNAEFQKYFPGKDVGNIQAYLNDITNFHSQFSKSEKFVAYCLQSFILPSVERYDTQLVSTPYDFCAQPARIKGFTGTSSSNLFLSPLRLVDLNPDNIESILIKLRKDVTKQSISYMDRNDDKAIISLILDKIRNNKNIRFIIELGGWFRGSKCANFAVASALLAGTEDDVESVVFFNDNKLSAISKEDPLNIIDFETSDPIELAEKLGKDLSKRLVYIDQLHARGADLPQTETTEAIVTVHETTALDEFAQGGTRLRHLLLGKQKLHIMSPKELKELCTNFEQFEMLFRTNQSEQRTNMAPQAIVGQLRSHVRRLIFKKTLTTSDLVTKKQLLEQSKELFILQNESDDSLTIETEQSTGKLLNAYAEKLILLYESLMPEEALQTLPALRIAGKKIINSKLALCKPTLLVQNNAILPQQESDQECQMRMHMSVAQQLTGANECQMTRAQQSEQTEEQELQNENETEIKQKVANARLIARPYNLAFVLNTWTIADFQNVGNHLLKINNMQFLRVSEVSEVFSCHLDPDIYITENAVYTLCIQDPSLAKSVIHVLGIATPSAMKFIILSVKDNEFLFDRITELSEELTAGYYIWLTTLQTGADVGKVPPLGHPQHCQMLVLWEQIQFCAGNVQYLIELADKKQLRWLTTGNVVGKLSVLAKLVNMYNPSHREYLDSLWLKINRLTSELSQPLLSPHTRGMEVKEVREHPEPGASEQLTETLNQVQKELALLGELPGNKPKIVSSGQSSKLLRHLVLEAETETDECLKPLDGSLGSSRLTRAHQSRVFRG